MASKTNHSIILKKSKNLISFSSKDSAIRSSDSRSKFFDISRYANNNLIDFFDFISFEKNSSQKFSFLLEDYEYISNSKDVKELQKKLEKINFELNKGEQKMLTANFEGLKEKIIAKFSSQNVSVQKKLEKLQLDANNAEIDTSIYPLYLSVFFLKGTTKNGDVVNAPLFLIPIKIEVLDDNIKVSKVDNEFIINEKLEAFLLKQYDFKKEFLKCKNYVEIIRIISEGTKADLKGLDLQKPMNSEFEPFISHNSDQIRVLFRKLSIERNAALQMIDPKGGLLKGDIEIISKRNELGLVFKTKSLTTNHGPHVQSVIEKNSISQIGRPLNIYQKYAVESSLNEDTLIHGPPGTGKSETIANIIANVIKLGKTSLLVSEKKAALEVLEERLYDISDIVLFAFDMNDKDRFYEKINKVGELFPKKIDSEIINKQKININKNDKLFKDLKYDLSRINEINRTRVSTGANFYNYLNTLKLFDKVRLKYLADNVLLAHLKSIEARLDAFVIDVYEHSHSLISDLFELSKILLPKHFENILNNFNKLKDVHILMSSFTDKRVTITTNFVLNGSVSKIGVPGRSLNKEESYSEKKIEELIRKCAADSQLTKFILQKEEVFAFMHFLDVQELSQYNNLLLWSEKLDINILDSIFDKNLFNYKDKYDNYYDSLNLVPKNTDKIILQDHLKKIRIIYENLSDEKKKVWEQIITYSLRKEKLSVNKFIKKFYEELRIIFPVWIMNPTQVSLIVPLKRETFDYGIFDEASQMFLERAFPVVYRCKINVIAGDEKQLRPTSFFHSRNEIEDEEEDLENDNVESLLDKAKLCMWSEFHLKNHYRSLNSNLIDFSNRNFYNSSLNTASVNTDLMKSSIVVYNVPGVYNERVNEVEADTIVNIIGSEYKKFEKILVVTLNVPQSELIDQKIFQSELYLNEEIRNKIDSGNIQIKNLENVQGNEADLVILSICFAKNSYGLFKNHFGVLSQNGGGNRLNVAITRAKKQMIVVKSIKSEMIKSTESNETFKKFIHYVDNVDSFYERTWSDQVVETHKFPSKFHEEINNLLMTIINLNKYRISYDFKIGNEILDFALLQKNSTDVTLGIVLDSKKNRFDLQRRVELADNQNFLENRGYKVLRILEIEWNLYPWRTTDQIFKTMIVDDYNSKNIEYYRGEYKNKI